MKSWTNHTLKTCIPFDSSSISREAITYTLGQWEKHSVFTRDGRVQIDNNLVENAIRPSSIGKKNWFFMGDARRQEIAPSRFTP